MKKSVINQFLKDYSEQALRIDPFATQKLGLLQSQSALKIDTFDVICAPYRISMQKAEVFVVLSKEELPFFRHYTTKTATLKLAFQPPEAKMPLKFIVWVNIDKLSIVKGKENMVMVDLSYKSCPEALVELIGGFFERKRILGQYYEKFKEQQIAINNDTSQKLRFNNYLECVFGGRNVECKLISLGMNRCTMLVPGVDPSLAVGIEVVTKFFFQRFRFSVKGKIEKLHKRDDGFLSVTYGFMFVPELADILSEYFIKQSLAINPAEPANPGV
jgi:hypothetical protein